MYVPTAVRIVSGKISTLAYLLCILLASTPLHAEYLPDQIRLTPKIDLHLEPVSVEGLSDRTLNLPPGFKVKLFSDQVDKARFMAWDDQGVLHVANMKTRGSNQWSPASGRQSTVLALPDKDGDGRADTVYKAADDFHWPHSVAFYRGALFVADDDAIYRLEDRDSDGFYEERAVFAEVPGFMGRSSEHVTHTLVFDESNDKLYFHAGSSCDLCREDDPERATVIQMNTDGTGRRIYASGLRNAIGLDLHPVTGELWGAGNGHDREGRDLPPEWITPLRDGGFYGWPLAYAYQVWTDFSIGAYRRAIFPLTDADSLLVASMERPAALVPAHLAPMGLHFYKYDQFPPQYKHAAFVAFRAGVLGNDLGYKVMALFAEPDGSNARVADFLTGFRPDPNNNSFWGTPVGLSTDEQGVLYLTSDRFTQAIFRIEASPLQGSWENSPPDTLLAGAALPLRSTIRLRRQLEGTDPVQLTADLSALEGPEALPLQVIDDHTYRLEADLSAGEHNGRKKLVVHLAQGDEATKLVHSIVVLPKEDQVLFADELAWEQGALYSAQLDPTHADTVFAGQRALRVEARGFTIEFLPRAPVAQVGYVGLRMVLHPGTATGGFRPSFGFVVNGETARPLSLIDQVDLDLDQWQTVEIALDELALDGPIESLRLIGSLRGTFYLDEIRLVAAQYSGGATAVREEDDRIAVPRDFALDPNYPNPFNSTTTIRYRIAEPDRVRLEIFDIQGQKVKTLADGDAGPGVYQVEWDGTDVSGKPVATGVYLARLQKGTALLVHKMLLLK
ncbi:MAG: PQQ-dependent sugar dehydrogenase [Gemmatimonadota bacterium]|nr:PQQ-dependent sugar dehydrogenase [Gemmatimonadota bacterium]